MDIVVGIDGSKASMAALAFAYEEAELRGIELLGSVSSACVQHASCPVVVVRPE